MVRSANRTPKISVVIPIYNSAQYLEQTIESVIAQNIGFSQNIEVILVDDGSTDSSGDICSRYVTMYPKNIRYVRQVNGGVSIARNNGINYATAKYVHFLDSDDLISKNFYRKSVQFLDKNKEVNIVASKIKFFDAVIDSHVLNYKFKKTRIINLDTDPNNPLLHMATCIFRRSAIDEIHFDEKLKISEDLKFLSDILSENKQYGVLSDTAYFYRKRQDESSAIGGKLNNRDYYLVTPKQVYDYIIRQWTIDANLHLYAQHTLLYDLSYRLKQSYQTVLSDNEKEQYKKHLKKILEVFSIDAILQHDEYDIHEKAYLGSLIGDDSKGLMRDRGVQKVHIDFISINGDSIKIEGYTEGLISNKSLTIEMASEKYATLLEIDRVDRRKEFLGDLIYDGGGFTTTIPLDKGVLTFKNYDATLAITLGRFTGLNNIKSAYVKKGETLIYRQRRGLKFTTYSRIRHGMSEVRYLLRLLVNWNVQRSQIQFKSMLGRNFKQLNVKAKMFEVLKPVFFIGEAIITLPQALYLRVSNSISRQRKRHTVWIVSDRGLAAGDNGEALFRYAMSMSDSNHRVFFAISKRSADYERLKKIGPVLDYGSLQYKRLFLLADAIISSHADIEVTNPFSRQEGRFIDLFKFNFIFLQHGVIRHDHSAWLNRYEKNIQLFITSAHPEYESILEYPYYYDEQNILLSGLPRFDQLHKSTNNTKKLIITPTYRAGILHTKTDKNGGRVYDPLFIKSEYFKFYNELINDVRLIDALNKSGMTAELFIHPNFAAQVADFKPRKPFSIPKYPYNYTKALIEGALIVSDYSSVAVDFAYMKKPVIYTKFDEDIFYQTHTYGKSEFFSDERDGFGVVTYTYNELVNEILTQIQSGCEMQDIYKKRVDQFFYKIDQNNSKRVYDAIINLETGA